MKARIICWVILLFMPLVAWAEENKCKTVYSGHGITQMDCDRDGKIDTITIKGHGSIGPTHVYIGKTEAEAKKLGSSYPTGGHHGCHSDHFLLEGAPSARAFQKPITQSSTLWNFYRALVRL